MIKSISLVIMAVFYIAAGLNHFRAPWFYYKLIPPQLPKKPVNVISGFAEVLLGIGLLIPSLSVWSAWGVIALLIAVYPGNIYHLSQKGAGMKIPIWALWVRLGFQGVFIAWAYWHTIM